MADEEYKVTGSFANNTVVAFKSYVKDGALDVQRVKKDYALNERQIPHLVMELEAAGYLGTPERADTQPLEPVVVTAPKQERPAENSGEGKAPEKVKKPRSDE